MSHALFSSPSDDGAPHQRSSAGGGGSGSGSGEADFAALFFAAPGLCGARLTRQGDAVASFATARQPDARVQALSGATLRNAGAQASGTATSLSGLGLGCAGLIAVAGLAAIVVGGVTFSSSSSSFSPSSSGSSSWSGTGATPTPATPPPQDAAGSTSWQQARLRLADDLAPDRADLVPYAVRGLLDAPRVLAADGARLDWLEPRIAASDRSAHARGRVLASTLAQALSAQEQSQLALILDLPGPQAVSAAAGLAQLCCPVFTSDNLPHPSGLIASDRTLAALLYWRPVLRAAVPTRLPAAPPVFVLEGDRLTPYGNQPDRFDNRSQARLPDADGLRRLGITRVLHVRATTADPREADDLNALFVSLADAGIEVRHLGLDAYEPQFAVEADPANASVAAGSIEPSTPSTLIEPTGTSTNLRSAGTSAGSSTSAATRSAPGYSPLHLLAFVAGYGWGRTSGMDPQAAGQTAGLAANYAAHYRTTPRASLFSPGTTITGFDGGAAQRQLISRAYKPPPAPVRQQPQSQPSNSGSGWNGGSSGSSRSSGSSWGSSGSSGGSWSRSSGSSSS